MVKQMEHLLLWSVAVTEVPVMFPVFETVVVTDCEVTTVSALSERLQAVIKSIYDIQTAEAI